MLTAPQVVQFDFGNIASPTGWNQYSESGLSGLVLDTTGSASTISIDISSSLSNDKSFLNGQLQGGSNIASVFEDALTLTGNGNDNFIITISGLDPLASYDIFAGGQSPDDSFGAEWTIGSITELTQFQDTDSFANFSNITPDASGVIQLEIDDINNGNANNNPGTGVGISELTMTLVPEPSSTMLLG